MYKIMLADDEGIVIDSLTFIIRQNFGENCEIASAKTGRSVIELAESFRPDIAFMDIQMPGINGIEAMKEIKKNNSNTIFIVMSAYDKFDYAKEAINLGVLDYLNKPVNQKKIVSVLQKAMDLIDARREKRSRDLEIKEKLEFVVPVIEQGFVMAGLLQEGETSGIENYRELLGMTEHNMFTLVLEFGEEIEDEKMTNPVGTGVRLQSFYSRIRDIIKDYYHCFIGPLMTNRLVCCVPIRRWSRENYDSRVRDVARCQPDGRKKFQSIRDLPAASVSEAFFRRRRWRSPTGTPRRLWRQEREAWPTAGICRFSASTSRITPFIWKIGYSTASRPEKFRNPRRRQRFTLTGWRRPRRSMSRISV